MRKIDKPIIVKSFKQWIVNTDTPDNLSSDSDQIEQFKIKQTSEE